MPTMALMTTTEFQHFVGIRIFWLNLTLKPIHTSKQMKPVEHGNKEKKTKVESSFERKCDMKRDEKELLFAVNNSYKYVMATPEGEIVGFGLCRATLEKSPKFYRLNCTVYTIKQYIKATEGGW